MKDSFERKAAFCAAIVATGGNVTRACKAVDIDRVTPYRWRDEDPDFAKSWAQAREVGAEVLEDEVRRRAYEGVERPLLHNGKVVRINRKPATVTTYSDTLAIFLLKGAMPDKYRERSEVEMTGSLEISQKLQKARERVNARG